MTSQVLLVDLDEAMGTVEGLLEGCDCSFNLVDDLDEALEMAQVTGVDLIVANADCGALDPVEVVARCYAEISVGDPPFVFFHPHELDKTRIVRRIAASSGEFVVSQPPRRDLGRILRALVSGEAVPVSNTVEAADVRERLLDIGFNDKVDVEDRRYSIQTEVTVQGGGVLVRSKVYELGKIILVRDFPAEIGADPVADVERLANDIHRESCVSVVLRLADGKM